MMSAVKKSIIESGSFLLLPLFDVCFCGIHFSPLLFSFGRGRGGEREMSLSGERRMK
jgi:hypothetical protein